MSTRTRSGSGRTLLMCADTCFFFLLFRLRCGDLAATDGFLRAELGERPGAALVPPLHRFLGVDVALARARRLAAHFPAAHAARDHDAVAAGDAALMLVFDQHAFAVVAFVADGKRQRVLLREREHRQECGHQEDALHLRFPSGTNSRFSVLVYLAEGLMILSSISCSITCAVLPDVL